MNLVKKNIKLKTIVNTSVERHPVPILGIDYRVKIEYKNVKITELDIEGKTIKISLPNKYRNIQNNNILDLAIDKMYEQIAKVEIERAMEEIRILVGFAPEEFEIKDIPQLGKCSNKKITINPQVVVYNRKVIDYIVLHQYCHLKYKSHTKGFYKLLETYMPDYKKYEAILLNM